MAVGRLTWHGGVEKGLERMTRAGQGRAGLGDRAWKTRARITTG